MSQHELSGTRKRNTVQRISAVFMAVILALSLGAGSAFADSADVSGSPRLTQPSVSHAFSENQLAVVNFAPKWGDKDANVAAIEKDIEQAAAQGTKILLFPEMSVTGYAYSSNPNSKAYKMPVKLAEDLDGPTQKAIAALSDKYDMWVIYGGTQKAYNSDGSLDTKHAYNSEFACSPEGKVTAYQKITPVEGSWCKPGMTPVLIDAGEYGKLGLSICYDTYATPELGRYYAAQGCNILLNATATSRSYSSDNDKGWEWYYKNRLESNAAREGYTIMSANLTGADGPEGDNKSKAYNFPGGSVICKGTFSGMTYYAGVDDSQLGQNTTNTDILTGTEGIEYNCADVTCSTGSTTANKDFNPEMYAKLYKELADEQDSGKSLSYRYTSHDGPKAAVVNMTAKWGDVAATTKIMDKYVDQAAEKNVDVLVFPEMALNGYQYVKPDNGEDPMQVKTAETKDGPTAKHFAELAKKNNMYIIYGASEMPEGGPITENGKKKVYNSAFICSPDGTVDTYQKIHRAGAEDQWSVAGNTPKMFTISSWRGKKADSPDIKAGIDICRDGHFYPELGRYYAAQGCTLFIHPTATTGNAWYRETRIGSYTDRDGMAAITCNLLGIDGPTDDNGQLLDKKNGYDYESTSLIITKYHDANGNTSWDRSTGYAIDLNGTGSASAGYRTRHSSPKGLEVAQMDLYGTGFNVINFNPRLYSQMYDKLAQLYRGGYQTLYPGQSVAQPKTVDLAVKEPAKPAKPSKPAKPAKQTHAKKAKKAAVKTVTLNQKTISAKAIDQVLKKAGAHRSSITTVVLGKKVQRISAGAFKYLGKASSIRIQTGLLTSSKVKGSLSKSHVKTVKVAVSSKKSTNGRYVAKYKKVFTAKTVGKKVTVKASK